MKPQILSALVFLFALTCNAQQAFNLDFEKLSVEGTARPWGWDNSAWSAKVSMDSTVKESGKYCLLIDNSAGDATQDNALVHNFEPYELKKKTIEIKGYVKTEPLKGKSYIVFTYAGKNIFKSDTIYSTIRGTDWQVWSITSIKIPAHVWSVALSVGVKGAGKAWFDNFTLTVNGKTVTSLEAAKPFTAKQYNKLKELSTPVLSTIPTKAGDAENFSDLTVFNDVAKDATIIALGETTHGTGEFFSMKHRLLEYSVKQLGVRIFAMEANMLAVEKVNKFVTQGIGAARNSMSGFFMVWYNQEVCDMIQWVRDYNIAHPNDMVEFMGFDMQDIVLPLDSLASFLNKYDKPLADSASLWLHDLKAGWQNAYTADSITKYNWFAAAELTLKNVSAKKATWLSAAKNKQDSTAIEWGVQYATLVKQYAENTYRGHISFYRDKAMAENISWILSQHKPGSKIVVWAHDTHISRGVYRSMGSHLSKKYRKAYKAFGLASYTGTYSAQPNYFNFKHMPCPLYPSPAGSLDEAMHRITQDFKTNALFLNLKGARNIGWLVNPLPIRSANHVNIDYGYWLSRSIPYQFDGIFFIDKTNAALTY